MTMSLVETYSEFHKINPTIGKFIAGGIIVCTGAALVLSLGSDLDDLLIMAGYLLGLSLLAVLIHFIATNEWIRAVLSWTVTVFLVLFLVGFVESVLQLFHPRIPPTACYLRMLIMTREACEDMFAPIDTVIGAQTSLIMPRAHGGPERIWRTQLTATPTVTGDRPYQAGQIYLQIAPSVDRRDAITLSQDLEATGWGIEGGDQGGELVKKAPSRNEVRYFHKGDAQAARDLAQELYNLNPSAPVHVRNFSRLGAYAGEGNLEIWLNSIEIEAPGTDG